MAHPVTTGGSVTCANDGKAELKSTARLTVSGKPVLPYAALGSLGTYVGCTFTSNTAQGPCTKTAPDPAGSGKAARLTVGGQPVLLDDAKAQTSTPPPPLPIKGISAGQTKLTAS
jgi:hypothetical protein